MTKSPKKKPLGSSKSPGYRLDVDFKDIPIWAVTELVDRVRDRLGSSVISSVSVQVSIRLEDVSDHQAYKLFELDEELMTQAEIRVRRENGSYDSI